MPSSFFNLRANLAGEPTFVEGLLTSDECRAVIAAGERDLQLYAGKTANHQINEKIRKSEIGWLSPDDVQLWLFDTLRECVAYLRGWRLLGSARLPPERQPAEAELREA